MTGCSGPPGAREVVAERTQDRARFPERAGACSRAGEPSTSRASPFLG